MVIIELWLMDFDNPENSQTSEDVWSIVTRIQLTFHEELVMQSNQTKIILFFIHFSFLRNMFKSFDETQ